MKVLLIIPCFNEESRLNLQAFEEGRNALRMNGIDLTFLFANDGSSDGTQGMLEAHCRGAVKDRVYQAPQNLGKGNVIQAAFQSIPDAQGYDWIGFWDADLATPLAEVPRMLQFLEFYPQTNILSIWGSRISRLGSRINRQMHRHYLGRIFVTIVSNLLDVKAYDSQCGAKLFRPAGAAVAFKSPFISRWIFDVEILLRLKEESVIEYPVFQWEDVPGSKVKVLREILRVGNDLLRIRKTYR